MSKDSAICARVNLIAICERVLIIVDYLSDYPSLASVSRSVRVKAASAASVACLRRAYELPSRRRRRRRRRH